jgi:nicotinate-nucleotide adenylyltransferase
VAVERLGIFGGTFDPVHIGHLVAASAARHHLDLSRVLMMTARDPWQKHGAVRAPADARFEMLAAAIDGVDGLEASRLELDRPGPTGTMDTVEALQSAGRELFLILGADAAANVHTWRRVEELRAAVTLAVIARVDQTTDGIAEGWRVVSVPMPRLDVSSTDLRRRVAAGEPVDFLIPAASVRVLRRLGLYTAKR